MMAPNTTTIRVDSETHARLAEMSSDAGRTLIETVRDAAEALHRQRFADAVNKRMAELQADPEAWADYLGEVEGTSGLDGLGR